MSRLEVLAVALSDLANNATASELEQALELCVGFAERVQREDRENDGPSIPPTEIRRPN
jgi:hypothetical protein